jgi:hypothetical protein
MRDAWTPQGIAWQSKPLDLPPAEAMYDLWHPWWNFLDKGEKVLAEAVP